MASIEKYPQDDFDYDNEDDFDDICDMYSDNIDLEHSSCCICRISEEWKWKDILLNYPTIDLCQ